MEIYKHYPLETMHFDSKYQRQDQELLRSWVPSWRLIRHIALGLRLLKREERVASFIDNDFFDEMQKEFGIRPSKHEYYEVMKKAVEPIIYIYRALSLPEWNAGLINNVSSPSDSPYDNFKLLLARHDEIDPFLRHQLLVQNLFMLITYGLNNRKIEAKVDKQLHDFIKFTDQKIFDLGRIGETKSMDVYSLHDTQNKTLGYSTEPIIDKGGAVRLKKTSIRYREINVGGERMKVIFESREKELVPSILKILVKSIKEGKPIDWKNAVMDLIGTKFVVIEGDVDKLITHFEGLVNEYFNNPSIEPDDNTSGKKVDDQKLDRGSSPAHNFKRRQIYLNNNKFECIFQTAEQWLNDQYHIGTKIEDGSYNGASHRVYAKKRERDAAQIFVPADLLHINLKEYTDRAFESVAQELIAINDYQIEK